MRLQQHAEHNELCTYLVKALTDCNKHNPVLHSDWTMAGVLLETLERGTYLAWGAQGMLRWELAPTGPPEDRGMLLGLQQHLLPQLRQLQLALPPPLQQERILQTEATMCY